MEKRLELRDGEKLLNYYRAYPITYHWSHGWQDAAYTVRAGGAVVGRVKQSDDPEEMKNEISLALKKAENIVDEYIALQERKESRKTWDEVLFREVVKNRYTPKNQARPVYQPPVIPKYPESTTKIVPLNKKEFVFHEGAKP